MEEAAELEELMILSDKICRDRIIQKFGDRINSVEARVSSISQVCIYSYAIIIDNHGHVHAWQLVNLY